MASAVGPQVSSLRPTEPAWSFQGKTSASRPAAVPGVGTYEAVSSLGKQVTSLAPTSPIITFGARNNVPQDSLRVPGPGTYEAPDAFGKQPASVNRSAPAYTMTSRISRVAQSTSPGPGAYETPSAVGKQPVRRSAPRYTIAGRPVESPRGDSPGPGEHEVDVPAAGKQPLSTHTSAPSYSMGVRRFHKLKDEANPNGPGECRTDGAFGKQPYSVKRSAPLYSFGSRTGNGSPVPMSKNPGPGAHELKPMAVGTQASSRARNSPAFSLGTKPHPPPQRRVPGPGTYEARGAIGRQPLSAHHSAPAYRFGADNTRAKQFSRGQGPGPGTYEPVGAIGSASRAKGPTIKGRQKFGSHTVAADSPGPGAYTAPRSPLTRRKAPPAYSFPGSARSHVDRRDVPGPGHYDEVRPKGNGFTIRGRYKVSTKQWEREGPGRCREKSMFGTQVDSLKRSHGGFTMGSRFRSRAADTTPGPGAYMEFSRGVRSVPMGRKLNLTGKKTRKRRVRRRRKRAQTAAPGGRTRSSAGTPDFGVSSGSSRRVYRGADEVDEYDDDRR